MKIKISFLLCFIVIMLYASFEEYKAKLNYGNDSLQLYIDSVLINDYPKETFEYSIKMFNSKNWIKRYIAMRIMKKYKLNDSLYNILLNNIPLEYFLRVSDSVFIDESFLKRIMSKKKYKMVLSDAIKNNPKQYLYLQQLAFDSSIIVSMSALRSYIDICKEEYVLDEKLLNQLYHAHSNYFILSLIDSILYYEREYIKDTTMLLKDLNTKRQNRIYKIIGGIDE